MAAATSSKTFPSGRRLLVRADHAGSFVAGGHELEIVRGTGFTILCRGTGSLLFPGAVVYPCPRKRGVRPSSGKQCTHGARARIRCSQESSPTPLLLRAAVGG
jgi:hypothetical protein